MRHVIGDKHVASARVRGTLVAEVALRESPEFGVDERRELFGG